MADLGQDRPVVAAHGDSYAHVYAKAGPRDVVLAIVTGVIIKGNKSPKHPEMPRARVVKRYKVSAGPVGYVPISIFDCGYKSWISSR
jgi:hypothetical protein